MLYYTGMKNINKNLIFYGLAIALVILVIFTITSIFMPNKAYATGGPTYVPGHYNSNGGYTYGDFVWAPKPVENPVYQPVVYQNNYSNAPMAGTNTTEVSNYDSRYYSESNIKTSSTGDTSITGSDYKNLTANSVFGGLSFMPSGLMQWILLGIFILVIVILVRKVTGKGEEYHATPLKHA